MRRFRIGRLAGLACCVGLLSPSALAQQPETPEAPDTIEGQPLHPKIYGGQASSTCGWPTTVLVESGGGLCTGTLIHPQVVITAAHCSGANEAKQIGFGPNGNSRTRSATCHSSPSYNGSATNDISYCVLNQPVDDVPIVPVLDGCEVGQYIKSGQPVTIVGYGETNQGIVGTKYEVSTTITGYQGGEVSIGGGGKDSCSGDSGGPVYVQIADGSWRVFGITSYGGQCGSGGVYGNMANNIDWVEQQTGIDLTPCFDSQGNWTPNPFCGGFPTDPGSGANTTWTDGCGGGPVSDFASTCGPPFSAEADDTPPSVTLTAPSDGATYMTGGASTVEVQVSANASDNVAVAQVSLRINGMDVANSTDTSAPYEWALQMPAGSWMIEAVALDYSDNQATSNLVSIGVDQDPEPSDTGDSSSSSGGGESDSGGADEVGTDSGLPPSFGGSTVEIGCSCSTATNEGGPLAQLLALLGLAGLVRRRRGAA